MGTMITVQLRPHTTYVRYTCNRDAFRYGDENMELEEHTMIASVRIVCPMYDPFLRSEGRLATPRKTCTAFETFPGLNEKASHARMPEVTRCYATGGSARVK